MKTKISKTEFTEKASEILRAVEETGQSVLITDRGVPIIEVRRYRAERRTAKEILKGSVLRYDDPFEPTGAAWEALE